MKFQDLHLQEDCVQRSELLHPQYQIPNATPGREDCQLKSQLDHLVKLLHFPM